jgi:hypothetical protein
MLTRRSLLLALILICTVAGAAQARLYKASAPPMTWGPWLEVGGAAGPVTFRISYEAEGDTMVKGQVSYPTDDGMRVVEFMDSITVRTCDCYGPIEVRFKGVPLGSSVMVSVH